MATQVMDDEAALQQLREAAPVRQVAQLVHAASGRRMALLEGVNRVGRSPAPQPSTHLVDLTLFCDPVFNVVSRAHFDVTVRAQSDGDGTASPVLTLTRLPASRNSIFVLRQQYTEGAAVNAMDVELEVEPSQLAPLRPRQLFIIPSPAAPALAFYIELSKPGRTYLESGAARSTTAVVATQGGDEGEDITQPNGAAQPAAAPAVGRVPSVARSSSIARAPSRKASVPAALPAAPPAVHRAASNTEPVSQPAVNNQAPSLVAAPTLLPYDDDDDMDAPTPPVTTQDIARAAAAMDATQIAVYDATQAPVVEDDEEDAAAAVATKAHTARAAGSYRPVGKASGGIIRKLSDPSKHASQGNEYSLPTWLPDATLPTQMEGSPDRPVGNDATHAPTTGDDGDDASDVSEVLGGLDTVPSHSSEDEEKERDAPIGPVKPAHPVPDTMGDSDAEDVPLAVLRARKAAATAGPPLRSPENSISPSVQPTEAQLAEVSAAVAQAVAQVGSRAVSRSASMSSRTRPRSIEPTASSFAPAQPTPTHPTPTHPTPLAHSSATQPGTASAKKASPLLMKALSRHVSYRAPVAEATEAPEDTHPQAPAASEAPSLEKSETEPSVTEAQAAQEPVFDVVQQSKPRVSKRARMDVQVEADAPAVAVVTAPRGRAVRGRKSAIAPTPAPTEAAHVDVAPAEPLADAAPPTCTTARAGVKRARAPSSRAREAEEAAAADNVSTTRDLIPEPAPVAEQTARAEPPSRKRARKSDVGADFLPAPEPAVETQAQAAATGARRKRGRAAEEEVPAEEAPPPPAKPTVQRRGRGAAAAAPPSAVVDASGAPAPAEAPASDARPRGRRGSASAAAASGRSKPMIVAFTGLNPHDSTGPDSKTALANAATKLGATVDDSTDALSATHLVAPRVMTTPKFLRAISHTPFIVTPAWLRDSAAAGHALPEQDYLPEVDEERNPELKELDLATVISARTALPSRPLEGVTMYLLPPVDDSVRDIVKTAGGNVAVSLGEAKKALKDGASVVALLMSESNVKHPVVQDASAAGINVCMRKLLPLAVFHSGIRPADVKAQSATISSGGKRK